MATWNDPGQRPAPRPDRSSAYARSYWDGADIGSSWDTFTSEQAAADPYTAYARSQEAALRRASQLEELLDQHRANMARAEELRRQKKKVPDVVQSTVNVPKELKPNLPDFGGGGSRVGPTRKPQRTRPLRPREQPANPRRPKEADPRLGRPVQQVPANIVQQTPGLGEIFPDIFNPDPLFSPPVSPAPVSPVPLSDPDGLPEVPEVQTNPLRDGFKRIFQRPGKTEVTFNNDRPRDWIAFPPSIWQDLESIEGDSFNPVPQDWEHIEGDSFNPIPPEFVPQRIAPERDIQPIWQPTPARPYRFYPSPRPAAAPVPGQSPVPPPGPGRKRDKRKDPKTRPSRETETVVEIGRTTKDEPVVRVRTRDVRKPRLSKRQRDRKGLTLGQTRLGRGMWAIAEGFGIYTEVMDFVEAMAWNVYDVATGKKTQTRTQSYYGTFSEVLAGNAVVDFDGALIDYTVMQATDKAIGKLSQATQAGLNEGGYEGQIGISGQLGAIERSQDTQTDQRFEEWQGNQHAYVSERLPSWF